MSEFLVSEDGLMTEKAIRELAEWYNSYSTGGDSLNYEAHVMLLRAYLALTASSESPSSRGFSRSRYNVLRILYRSEGRRLLMSDIGAGLNVNPTNVTKLVDGLEEDGWVRRVPDPEDRRRTWAELTEQGAAALERALPGVIAHTERVWGAFSSQEKRVLIHLLAKLRMVLLSTKAERAMETIGRPGRIRRATGSRNSTHGEPRIRLSSRRSGRMQPEGAGEKSSAAG